MLVVSNTSPISNLAIIERLELLRRRYQHVIIPVAVLTELQALTHFAAKERITAAISEGWLRIDTTTPRIIPLPVSLDPGKQPPLALQSL